MSVSSMFNILLIIHCNGCVRTQMHTDNKDKFVTPLLRKSGSRFVPKNSVRIIWHWLSVNLGFKCWLTWLGKANGWVCRSLEGGWWGGCGWEQTFPLPHPRVPSGRSQNTFLLKHSSFGRSTLAVTGAGPLCHRGYVQVAYNPLRSG